MALFAITISTGYGQTAGVLNFSEYMRNIISNNVDYVVEKYNVDIANANAQAARVFPDPELMFMYGDNQDRTLQLGRTYEASLGYTLELGGKRRARIDLARSEAALTDALLEEFFCNLRADATLRYLTAIRQKQLLEVARSSFEQMRLLAQADSVRLAAGEITEADARQSRLEAATMHNNVLRGEVELRNAMVEISLLQGNTGLGIADSLAERLNYVKRDFDIDRLIAHALDNRADLKAAMQSADVSQRNLKLAKANRIIDLGLNLGIGHNTDARNEIAPVPKFNRVTAGVSVPLRFSNFNKGAIRAAEYNVHQREAAYQAAEMQIRSEVIRAYNSYIASVRLVEQFSAGMIADAEAILASRITSYHRGEASLLDVITARLTLNSTHESYYHTLYDSMDALTELERCCGTWSVEL